MTITKKNLYLLLFTSFFSLFSTRYNNLPKRNSSPKQITLSQLPTGTQWDILHQNPMLILIKNFITNEQAHTNLHMKGSDPRYQGAALCLLNLYFFLLLFPLSNLH